jgi:hypothetical protein
VIAAGPPGQNVVPDVEAREQLFTGCINGGNAKLGGRISSNGLRLMLFNDRYAQPAAL